MIKSKKLMSVLMTAILGSALFLTGCGEKTAAADVTVKAFYNLYITGDSTEIEKIALTKDEVTQVNNKLKTESEAATKKNVTNSGYKISDAQLELIYNAQREALKKLTVTTELVSEDGDNATVKLTTTYIDMKTIDTKAAEDAYTEVKAMQLTSVSEANTKFIESYANKLAEGLKAAPQSTETKEDTFVCEKKTYDVDGKNKDIFTPKDMESFGRSVAKMATNI